MAPKRTSGQRGRSRKYGARLGTCAEIAARVYSTDIKPSRVSGHYREVLATTNVVMLKTLK